MFTDYQEVMVLPIQVEHCCFFSEVIDLAGHRGYLLGNSPLL
jgi:hypothetical protein